MKIEDQMARTLVNESLRIKKQDVVVVSTYQHTIDMANAIAMECFKKGADVLMTLDTDDVFYGHLKVLSKTNLRTTSAHCLGLAEYTNVNIFIGGPEDPSDLSKEPPDKFSALFKGEQAHFEKSRKKGIRSAYLPLGLVTPQRAKVYGFSYNAWMKDVTGALRASPKKMSAFGKKLANRLSKAKKVHITSKQGTDLTFRLGKRPVHIYEGILDAADAKKGTNYVSLPSGEVVVTLLENSAEGKAVFDVPVAHAGKLVHNMRWKFKKGKLVDFKASRNLRSVKDFYDLAHGDKDKISFFNLGMNPNSKVGFLMNSIANGAVTIGIGGNDMRGGKNKSDYELDGTMSKATVKLDGKEIIKNGKYTI
ncbi:MAG: aminopeptidase [Methanobacteriota archaeon]|nr:MAG: aminopeptidase [Euryarchaeota archaeon]